ncbi:MAG: ABC transporter permease subunit [Chloroflexi bacterium]|nr:ABC transporter permease subunit [Chloroflexota bacterium]
MTRRRLKHILLKEWQLLFTDLNSALIVTLLPLLIVGQLMLYVWLGVSFGSESALASPLFQAALARLRQAFPPLAALTGQEQFRVLLLSQFNFFLLLIPTMIAVSTTAFSIVEEKVSGSLEALLATPVRTWELLLGKALAGLLPALVVTWLCAGVFLLIVAAMGWWFLASFVVTVPWFLSLFLLTPAVALLSFILGVIGSSRARDAKSAQNMALFIILPVFALIAAQVIGLVWFTPLLTVLLALVIGLIDYLCLRLAVRLFRRESILQWR